MRRSLAGLALRGLGLIGLVVCLTPSGAAAQGRGVATIVAPSTTRGDTLRSVTPTIVVLATGFAAHPLSFHLQIDAGPEKVDTTIVVNQDSSLAFVPRRALAEGAHAVIRATVTDAAGNTATSSIGPFNVPPWVTPISPPLVIGQPVRTRTPRFVWHSPAVSEPPGPWEYQIEIVNVARHASTFAPVAAGDTTFVPAEDLEPNAVYTWKITARLPRAAGVPQQTVVASPSNFTVEDPDVAVLATSLYQPFPNPFPRLPLIPGQDVACIWFDLKVASTVQLDVYDLRGLHVRRLSPSTTGFTGQLPAGRYGRGRTEFNEGCDQRLAWDGKDDRGLYVPEGVYIVRFRSADHDETRKLLFLGRQ